MSGTRSPFISELRTPTPHVPAERLPCPEFYAFVGSGSLLVLEIVAGRLLAPIVGVSLYTWTSIIGVVLGGVALGNWLGGKLADRRPTRSVLGLLFLLASLTSIAVLPLTHFVNTFALPASSSAMLQILWLFGLLFFLPSTLLGAVTPLLTKIALQSLESTGRVVGRIQGAATLGSIVGTFLTGFVLISWFGTRAIIAGVGGLLLALATAARPPFRRMKSGIVVLCFLISTALGLLGASSPCTLESNYYCIRVGDGADATGHYLKMMRLDALLHGVTDLDDPRRLVYGYEKLYEAVLKTHFRAGEHVDSMLLGGGSFSLARYLELTFAGRVVVAEIDPEVTATARAHFKLPSE